MSSLPVVTLTTDFGSRDSFVGAIKGVLLSRCPGVQIVDICHEVPPQAILVGAMRLASAAPYFPAGTVHLAVVDPGVGSERRAIAVRVGSQSFVGPDNGVLSLAAPSDAPGWQAVELTEPRHWLPRVSSTFHGRDVFAPVAAFLSAGGGLDQLGSAIDGIEQVAIPRPSWSGEGCCGVVIDVDWFGNLVTNISESDLAGRLVKRVEIGQHHIDGLSRHYDSSRRLVALLSSEGRLEIAAPGGSASTLADASLGAAVRVETRARPSR